MFLRPGCCNSKIGFGLGLIRVDYLGETVLISGQVVRLSLVVVLVQC